jgi:hypothetical protein
MDSGLILLKEIALIVRANMILYLKFPLYYHYHMFSLVFSARCRFKNILYSENIHLYQLTL